MIDPSLLKIADDVAPLALVTLAVVAVIWRIQPVLMAAIADRRELRDKEIEVQREQAQADLAQANAINGLREDLKQRDAGSAARAVATQTLIDTVGILSDRVNEQNTGQAALRTEFAAAQRSAERWRDTLDQHVTTINKNLVEVPSLTEKRIAPSMSEVRAVLAANYAKLKEQLEHIVNAQLTTDQIERAVSAALEAHFERVANGLDDCKPIKIGDKA